MRGGIAEDGALYKIGKTGPFSLFCPFTFEENVCGDLCPHFSEPREEYTYGGKKIWTLEICHGKVLKFDEFEDER